MTPRDAGRVAAAQYKPYHPWGGLGAKTLRIRQLRLNLNVSRATDARYILDLDMNRTMPATGPMLPRSLPLTSDETMFLPPGTDGLDPISTNFDIPSGGVPFEDIEASPLIDEDTLWPKELIKAKCASGEEHVFKAADFPSARFYEVSGARTGPRVLVAVMAAALVAFVSSISTTNEMALPYCLFTNARCWLMPPTTRMRQCSAISFTTTTKATPYVDGGILLPSFLSSLSRSLSNRLPITPHLSCHAFLSLPRH